MTRAKTAALIAVLALLAVPAVAAAASPTIAMMEKVNAFRHAHGLPSVHLNGSLEHSARSYAGDMMRTGYFGHQPRIHASRRFRTLGEIIEEHRGLRPNVGLTFRDWENSPEHRAIMLYGGFNFAGAGFVSGRFNGHRTTIWVMHFGHH